MVFEHKPCVWVRAALIFLLWVQAVPTLAAPEEAVKEFDIPAQALAQSLMDFSTQSAVTVVADAELVKDKQAPAVRGQISVTDALRQLLAGSGLSFVRQTEHAFVVVPSVEESTADTLSGLEVVVTGIRASLSAAQETKKNADQIVDSIVAEDIGKLPDTTIAEALQRIPGVQITRNNGEGSAIQIRGLSQVKTLLNGREIYSENGRDLSLENVPAEILGGVDVYKNPSSAMIEGGLGGVVNLKTRRPLDFTGRQASLSVRDTYYDLFKGHKFQISSLLSDRWELGGGEIGALVGVAYQETAARFDQTGSEPFFERRDYVDVSGNGVLGEPGDAILAPRGGGNGIAITDRKRWAVNAITQWRPNDAFEAYLEGTYSYYRREQDNYSIFANRGNLPAAPGTAITLWPGTNVFQSGTFTDMTWTSNTNTSLTESPTTQIVLGGKWQATDAVSVLTDLSYTRAKSDQSGGGLRVGNPLPDQYAGVTLFQDNSTEEPTLVLGNFDINDISNYSYIDSFSNITRNRGDGRSALLEGHYEPEGIRFLKAFIGGVRYGDRNISFSNGSHSYFAGTQPASLLPEGIAPLAFDDFFGGSTGPNLVQQLRFGPPFGLLHDVERICEAFNDTVCYPTINPLNSYDQAEETRAVYAQADFEFEWGLPMDGNVGVRWVETLLDTQGFRTTSGSSTPTAIDQSVQYRDALPSLNLRMHLSEDLKLRLAAAKQITRPSFGQLSPNFYVSFGTATGYTGSAGNPNLRPLRSTSYDASLEWYFSRTSYTYLASFYKNVDGFIQNLTQLELVNLPDFNLINQEILVTRPQNGGKGKIKGGEVGLQTFFTALPAPYDGLGLQVNYTYVDSNAPGPVVGTSVPLQGLSKNSYNAIGYYEKGPIQARIAYTYRDDYVETTSGPGSGALPIFAEPRDQIDASIGYKVSDHMTVTLDGVNLKQTKRSEGHSYFGEEDRPRFSNIFDRRISLLLRLTL
jgi:TonB-dependent receptor